MDVNSGRNLGRRNPALIKTMRYLGFALLNLCLAASAFGDVPGQWPRWRGPFDTGMARGDAPVRWSDTENLAWKITIPGLGHSSPVIWADRIFLTTAVPAGENQYKLTVMAIDRKSGKTVWEKAAATVTPHEGYHRRYGSYASNSPVTDGKRLYTFFGSHGAYAFDLDGKLLWQFDPGLKMRMRNAFGEGTAAVLDGDTLLLNYDHEGDDVLYALDAATGKPRWKVDRSEISNWSPPLVVTHDGLRQAILAAPGKVRAYEMKDGKLLWECAGLGANTIPAPVVHNGIVIVMSGFRDPNLLAIRLGRTGDLTGTDAIAWTTNRGTSYTASPVLHNGRIWFLTDSGMLSSLDAATGKPYYERVRLPKAYNFKASPVGVKDRLYLSSEEGDVIVVGMGDSMEVLATNTMPDQMFVSSPAVADGELYLRSTTHLFCVREKK